MKIFQNGFALSSLFFCVGAGIVVYSVKYPPSGILTTLFLFFLALVFLFLVPRGNWIAEQIRFRKFVAHSEPFETVDAAWTAFRTYDRSLIADDPLFRRWQALVDAKTETKAADAKIEEKIEGKSV